MIVPKYFYAAVAWKRAKLNVYSGLAFWFEHTNVYHGDDALKGYVVSISELQNKLGNKIDFFCNLPDKTEAQVEKVALRFIKNRKYSAFIWCLFIRNAYFCK